MQNETLQETPKQTKPVLRMVSNQLRVLVIVYAQAGTAMGAVWDGGGVRYRVLALLGMPGARVDAQFQLVWWLINYLTAPSCVWRI